MSCLVVDIFRKNFADIVISGKTEENLKHIFEFFAFIWNVKSRKLH